MSDIKVHLLPFAVDREGPINTKSYFKVNKDQDQYESVMLGRKLVGTAVSLADFQAQGHVWEKAAKDEYDDMEEDQEEEIQPWTRTNTTIEEFILWKKDSAPNPEDARINALHSWIDISQTIHAPVPLPTTATTTTTTASTSSA